MTEEQARRLAFEQGYGLRRPSEILVRLEVGNKEITGVHVGGKATAAKEKVFSLEEG